MSLRHSSRTLSFQCSFSAPIRGLSICLSTSSTPVSSSRRTSPFPSTPFRSFSTSAPRPWGVYVEDDNGKGTSHMTDIFSRMMKERTISVGPVDDDLAKLTVASLLYLEATDPEAPIKMYINSPGGVVTAGLAIYDTMQHIRPPVHTVCNGLAASMGSLLLAGGAPGHRYVLPNASIMIHQPSGGSQGTASDVAIQAEHILKMRANLTDIYRRHCTLPGESVEDATTRFDKAIERDRWLTAEESKAFGLVDHIVKSRKQVEKKEAELDEKAESTEKAKRDDGGKSEYEGR